MFEPMTLMQQYLPVHISHGVSTNSSQMTRALCNKITAIKVKIYIILFYFSRVVDNPIDEQENSTAASTVTLWAKNAFDNEATPYFALIICLWGKLQHKEKLLAWSKCM